MAVVGPGAIQEVTEAPKPLLEGASEYEFVTILNPLLDDFAIRVAQDVPVNMPFEIRDKTSMVQTEGDVTKTYGLGLKNPDFQGRKHITNDTIIKAGQTINLKGSEAQVAVRQLVNEILQREGHGRLLADPTLRNEVEGRIIRGRGSIQQLMDQNIQTPRNQIDEAISKSNEVLNDSFPELAPTPAGAATEASQGSGTDVGAQDSGTTRSPKKA